MGPQRQGPGRTGPPSARRPGTRLHHRLPALHRPHRRSGRGGRRGQARRGVPGRPRPGAGARRGHRAYGVARGDEEYEPAGSALPEVEEWHTGAYLDFLPELVRAVRDELGYGFELLHDGHHRLAPSQAGWLGRRLEPYRMFWLEDPVPEEDQQAFATVRGLTSCPIAVGEVWNSVHDCHHAISNRLIDYIRIPVTHGGGLTHLRQILALADVYDVRSGMQGASDISPIGQGANFALDWTIPNFGMQEYRLPRGHLEGLHAPLQPRERRHHAGRRPRPGRRLRRGGRGRAPVRAQVAAGEPSA
ncbi:enolase C-terminal domain-like protein [uncultured Propionibacterium sp.]|uniref:enolase C-terminal domain-like protein n=1 Tax=uncultured Propionibacterium sp. TaxID=218066 RepID=UPI00292DF456|nr:enolase C-terminal domain-like protein [uncultured Propionibacterium sp.]